ncbi:MAG: hypothetical protein IPJ71_18260 [Bdellovibrionales bacterium]|nr:hypothetical protein [Bdellovibrionales bacterium]
MNSIEKKNISDEVPKHVGTKVVKTGLEEELNYKERDPNKGDSQVQFLKLILK